MTSAKPHQCVTKLLEKSGVDAPLSDLRDFTSCLSSMPSRFQDDVLELEQADDDISANPFPGKDIFTICGSNEVAQALIGRVFNWRFGWTETQKGLKAKRVTRQMSLNHESASSALDQLIQWFLCHPISSEMIRCISSCIDNAKDRPIVRNKTSIHLVEWCKFQLQERGELHNFDQHFEAVKEALLVVVQDVWSAIRSACVSRLSGHVIPSLSLGQLRALYADLVAICNDADKAWQAREGAIMAIHGIMKRFNWTSSLTYSDDGFGSNSSHFLIFGSEKLDCMPDFISSTLKGCLLELLKHEQLTIRGYAVKTYTAYISKCDLNVAVSCFNDVLRQLCQGIDLDSQLPHMALDKSSFTFLEPYEAESLLGVCVYLIKHIPPQKVECLRTLYFSTFRLYLSHPASTVRLACSSIFKYIVACDSSNPDTMKYVLQGLCCEWVPDMDTFYTPQSDRVAALPRKSVSSRNLSEGDRASDTWEYREGRLLAYELIMQFLIKNHWLYTFGASYLNNDPVFFLPDCSKSRRRSSVSDTSSFQQMCASEDHQGQDEEGFRNRTSSTSRTKARDIPNKAKSDYPLSCSVGAGGSAFNRLATVTGVTHASSHVTHKHFSYYATGSDVTETRDASQMELATSLLIACQNKELSQTRMTLSPRTVDKLTSDIKDPCVFQSPRATLAGAANREWGEVQLETLTTLLERVLYETMECLADERWELRRMGSQLLPCLVEVIRWFDMKIVEDIWDNQLKADTTLLSYTACLALKLSVAHAARLQHVLKHPPSSWQDQKLCQRIILKIVDPIRFKVSGWSHLAYMMLQERPVIDRLSVVAIETLMLIHSHFDLTTGQKYAQLNRIVAVIKKIFCKAHESCRLAKEWSANHYTISNAFRSPKSGFLSCNLRNDQSEAGLAKQIEKHLLNETQHTLPSFLKMADAGNTHELLPVLCFHLGVYLEDDELCKAISESIQKLITQCNRKLSGCDHKSSIGKSILASYCLAMEQLVTIITNNNVDEHTFKQVCDMYVSVSRQVAPGLYLPHLVTTLMPKLSLNTKSTPKAKGLPRNDTEVNLLLSAPHASMNGAPLMSGDQSSSEDEDGDKDIDAAPIKESQTLNASMNSAGSGKGRVHQAVTSDESDDGGGSDWDSWDDDDASQVGDAGFAEAVKELFVLLQKASDAAEFLEEIEKLPEQEKRTVRSLLLV